MSPSPAALFEHCRVALRTTQVGLGEMLGVSRRTAQRWASAGVPGYHMDALVRLVHPHDAQLAGQIAASMGETLESLGIQRPAPPPAPAAPAPLASSPDSVVDAVVCAAAEAMEMTPRAVRPGLLAAFARARELELGADRVELVLRKSLEAPDAVAAAQAGRVATARPRPREEAEG